MSYACQVGISFPFPVVLERHTMSRVIVCVLSLGLVAFLLTETASPAPGGRGRAAAGRSVGTGGAARNAVSGPAGSGTLPRAPGTALSGVRNMPAGPIGADGRRSSSGPQRQEQLPEQRQVLPSNVPQTLSERATAYSVNASGPAPFSPAWYAQHPNAWQITHPHAGEAVVAVTAVGLASFMAIE